MINIFILGLVYIHILIIGYENVTVMAPYRRSCSTGGKDLTHSTTKICLGKGRKEKETGSCLL